MDTPSFVVVRTTLLERQVDFDFARKAGQLCSQGKLTLLARQVDSEKDCGQRGFEVHREGSGVEVDGHALFRGGADHHGPGRPDKPDHLCSRFRVEE